MECAVFLPHINVALRSQYVPNKTNDRILNQGNLFFTSAFAAAAEGSKGMEKYTIPEILTDNDWLHITGQAKSPIKLPFAPVKPKQVTILH